MRKFLLWFLLLLTLAGCRKIDPAQLPSATSVPQDTSLEETADTASTTAPPLETPAPQSVTISMVGDVLLHEPVTESGHMTDGSWQYGHLFQNVQKEIEAADVAIVNQEVILGGRALGLSGYPNFNGAFEVGDAIADAGFDVVLHATNHALDKKEAGVKNCLEFWRANHPEMAVLGIYDSPETRDAVYVREVNGIRIAILNYTYGTNGMTLPAGSSYGVNMLEESQVRADLASAAAQADFVIVAPHWGTEYTLEPDASQKRWTRIFYECGADLVIGTHPHVIQPVEIITGEKGDMLVYYSLGNFVNATAETGSGIANRMVGAMAQITVTMDDQGSAYISDYGVLPLITHIQTGPGQITTYKLSDYTQAMAEENEICKSDPSFSLKYCQDLCRKVFDDLSY